MNRESSFGMPSQRQGAETICGKCAHHMKGDASYGEKWLCLCDLSDNYLDETDYNFGCIDFEPRSERR